MAAGKQLHGNLTPAHADGCAAQCFEGVQRGSLIILSAYPRPQAATPVLRPGFVAHLFGRGPVLRTCNRVMAHRPYGSAQTGMYPSALCCAGGLPPGFLFQSAASNGNRERVSCFRCQGRFCQFMLTIEWMSLISSRHFMYSSTRTRGWPLES